MPRASGIARGMRALGLAHLFAQGRDPRIAGKGEEEEAGRLQDPVRACDGAAERQVALAGMAAGQGNEHDHPERDERACDEDAGPGRRCG